MPFAGNYKPPDKHHSQQIAQIVHLNGIILYANTCALKLFKAKKIEELIGTSTLSRVHPDDQQGVIERMKRGSVTHKEISLERHIALDGTIHWVALSASPVQYKGLSCTLISFSKREKQSDKPHIP